MKVEVKDGKKQEEIKYPCLMVEGDRPSVIYFYREGYGVGLVGGFLIYRSFDMSNFKPFTGSITLSNN